MQYRSYKSPGEVGAALKARWPHEEYDATPIPKAELKRGLWGWLFEEAGQSLRVEIDPQPRIGDREYEGSSTYRAWIGDECVVL